MKVQYQHWHNISPAQYTTKYLHRDHLGSVDVITNESGTQIEKQSFDTWGLRRDANDWQTDFDFLSFDSEVTTRGYTDHEHIDSMGLIHMNGRVYNPVIGRFLSADPVVQFPYNAQSYNRYSYVLNNSLSYTDPTGYSSEAQAGSLYYAPWNYVDSTPYNETWKNVLWAPFATAENILTFGANTVTGLVELGLNGIGHVADVPTNLWSMVSGQKDERSAQDIFAGFAAFPGGVPLARGYQFARGLRNFSFLPNNNVPNNTISASNPIEILYGAKDLSKRQQGFLDQLPNELSSLSLRKRDVNVNDLSHLTAKTGDEFALFTNGAQRLLVRGNSSGVPLSIKQLENLQQQGFKFSAHSHPGTSDITLNASGFPGDRMVIDLFKQEQSLILNSAGRKSVFDLVTDKRVQ